MIINNLGQIEHLIDGYITTNGAHCFVGEHVVCQYPISKTDVDRVVAVGGRDGYPFIVVGEKQIAICHPTPLVEEFFVKGLGVHNLDFQTSFDDLACEAIMQLTPFCTEEQENILMPTLDNCTSGRWHPAFTDITVLEADKGKGLRAKTEYLGIDISETMAFGDGGNDIPIIREAGVGVAMGNAGDSVKAVADYPKFRNFIN